MRMYRAEKQQTDMDPWQALANAIILQAVTDWRSAARSLQTVPYDTKAAEKLEECENFFRSHWFVALTDADGSYILRELKQEEKCHDE